MLGSEHNDAFYMTSDGQVCSLYLFKCHDVCAHASHFKMNKSRLYPHDSGHVLYALSRCAPSQTDLVASKEVSPMGRILSSE
jgi:hypothetical protein